MLKKHPKFQKNDQNKQTMFGLTKAHSLEKKLKNYALIEKSLNKTLTVKKNQRLLNGTIDRSKVLSTSTWSLNGQTLILKIYRALFRRSNHV